MKKTKTFFKGFIIIGIIIILFSIYNLGVWLFDNNHLKQIHDSLQDYYEETIVLDDLENSYDVNNSLYNPVENSEDVYWHYVDTPYLQIDFTDLQKYNEEVVAWIRVNGTLVDYPVVQHIDNQFYLNHSFDKKESNAGWIFSDFRNNLEVLNNNSIIYGHRRLNDSMFGSLRKTLYDDWLNNIDNHIILMSTLKENMVWQIFSVYSIKEESYYLTTLFKNDEDYKDFLRTIKDRSFHDFQTNLDTNDKILTLSTCLDGSGKTRIVIHARLIKKETKVS